ncbi:MAG: hypothetical protein AAGF10_04925 [Verrucomicrobiota bacterium]
MPDAPPEVYIRTTENRFFEVAGTDFDSVQYVTDMAQAAGEHGADIFPLSNALPLPILVKLVPATDAGFELPYQIRPQPNGDVNVLVRWSEDTRYEDVCQALASGFLVRSAIWRFGQSAGTTVPDWLELAMGLDLQIRLQPALIDQVVLTSRDQPSWTLARIFSLKGNQAMKLPEARSHSLWLMRYLRNQSPDREHYRRLMAGFLKNMPPVRLLVSAFPEKLSSQREMDLWWAVGYQATIRARQTPFFDSDESIRIVRDSSFVTAEIDGKDVRLGLDSLFAYRGNVALARAAQQRVREIKIDLQKINPIYYNSLLSLGLAYETWLDLPTAEDSDDPSADEAFYTNAISRFDQDFKSAQFLDLEIKRLLNW